MEEKFTYRFSQSLSVFFKYYHGDISLEDINSSWDYIIDNQLVPPETKGFVLDYRDAIMNIPPNQHGRIADYYKYHLDVFRGFKIAILTNDPKNVVISVLVESKDEGYESRPFSTLEAAVSWVLS